MTPSLLGHPPDALMTLDWQASLNGVSSLRVILILPLGSIADFFVSLFDKNCSVSTIRGYRLAIASFHAGFPDGCTVSNSPFLTRLLKSFFLKRPPSQSLIPSWSFPSVLRSLTSSPFEPLHKASLIHLTLKTVFLLAVALGLPVSSSPSFGPNWNYHLAPCLWKFASFSVLSGDSVSYICLLLCLSYF